MDQVKAALTWLKKHHFWVLAVAVLGATLGVWYTASTSIASQYDTNQKQISDQFQSVSGIRGKPFKPNDKINEEQQKEINKLAASVLQEWSTLYDKQKEEVLIWPEQLGGRFLEEVQGADFGDRISSPQRELYLNYIKETFPSLVKIVDAEPLTDGRRPSRRGGRLGESGIGRSGPGVRRGGQTSDGTPEKTYLVQWEDQESLSKRLSLDKLPSSLQIWTLQEDLWVYSTLLEAIARTNKATGATRPERAAVQVISELKAGQSAAGFDPTVARLQPPDAEEVALPAGGFGDAFGGGFGEGGYGGGYGGGLGGGYGGEGGYGGGYGGEGGYGGGYGGEGGFGGGYGGGGFGGGGGGLDMSQVGDDPKSALLAGRYLDDSDKPIMTVSEDLNFGREYKRLPVRMVLEMDSQWLTKLMWELATAPLQVEIEQVRFNPGGQSARRRNRGGNANLESFERRPSLGTVEIQGIIYMFNKPDAQIATVDE